MISLVTFLSLAMGLVSCQCSNNDCAYPAGCRNVSVCSHGVPFELAPFYTHVYYDNYHSYLDDNVCTTGIKAGGGSYLVTLSTVLSSGENVISTLIQSEVPGQDGVYRWQGKQTDDACSSCVFNDYTLLYLTGNCRDIVLVYRCFIYGSCVDMYSGQDTVLAFSPNPTIPDECYSCIQSAASSLGLNLGKYNALPKKLNSQCVTKIGNANTINAGSVSACNSLELN